MRILIVFLTLLCTELSAQAIPPNRPDRPDRPDRPTNPATERLVERQLDRAVNQLERVTERTPRAASSGLKMAEQQVKQAALRKLEVLSETKPGETTRRFPEIELTYYQDLPAVKQEWLLIVSDSDLSEPQPDAFGWQQYVSDKQPLPLLNSQILTLRLPQELDNLSSLEQILPPKLRGHVSRNFLFKAQSSADKREDTAESWRFSRPLCHQSTKVGLVDSAVMTSHSAFSQASTIMQRNFIDSRFGADQHHATAIASILVGQSEQHAALLPNAPLYISNVFFYASNLQTQSTLLSLITGLNWLAEEQVKVINMSLSGPDNSVLQQAVQALHQAGFILVAAVGNDGPAAPARYPAAYPEVIAVTAIDKQRNLYRWAVTGEHIDFAAPGVDLFAADADGSWQNVSGTSYAAPIVAAYIACLPEVAELNLLEVKAKLKQRAVRLAPEQSESKSYRLLIPES